MRAITLVLPYYENPGIVPEHVRAWSGYPPELQACLHVIMVDDGSPIYPLRPFTAPIASIRCYRILKDVRWNWLACRNLGVSEATTDWVLLTDIDHVLSVEAARFCMDGSLERSTVYRFSRVDAPHLTPYKAHPNTWFLTRKMFDAIGGYDERFSGYYGTDAEFRERVERAASQIVMRPEALIRYPREVIPDASTTKYQRKQPEDKVGVTRIRQERARIPNWRPLRLTFPWERIA